MSTKIMLFAALLLSTLSFASQTPLQKFLASSFEPDQTVVVQPLLYSGGNYGLATVDGAEIYLLDIDSGKAVADKAKLSEILLADSKNRSGFDAMASRAAAMDEAIFSLHAAREAQCSLLTGTDAHECTDKQTCILACKSNPNCDIILYSDGFWEAMLSWNTKKLEFDRKLLEYNSTSSGASASLASADASLSLADQLYTLAFNMSKSTIFLNRSDIECQNKSSRCYEYCAKVDYGLVQINASKEALLALKTALASAEKQPARAEAILEKSKQNDLYVATRNGKLQDFKVSAQNSLRSLSEKNAQVSQKLFDPKLQSSVAELSNLSEKIASLGDQGLYRQALAQIPLFDSKYSEASGRAASDLAAYQQLSGQLSALSEKVNKSAGIVGAQSAAAYSAQISELKASMVANLTLSGISEGKSKAEAISAKLNEEIAAKATGTAPQAGGGTGPAPSAGASKSMQLPCAPALAMLAIIGFASATRLRA
jgi:hypothetical protein